MNIRRTKHGLWVMTATFMVCGVAVLLVALRLPYDHPESHDAAHARVQHGKPDTRPTEPTLAQFAKLWNRDLRPPLFDPSADQSAAAVAPGARSIARPDIKLIGYAVESDQSLAILSGPDREVEFKAVGEQFLGVTVRSITSDGVTMDHDGDEYLLEFEEGTPLPQTIKRADRTNRGSGRYR